MAEPFVASGVALITPEGLGFSDWAPDGAQRGWRQHLHRLDAGHRAVIQARRIVDLLRTRPEIDSDRIYLMGISLGSLVAIPALAQEPRYRAGMVVWGAGNLPRLVERCHVWFSWRLTQGSETLG